MELSHTTLDNGLEVLGECNDEVHSVAVAFYVNTGARDETADVAGVSHFLEHMLFKGTPTRTAEQVNREFDAMGAYTNAATSKETTVYYSTVLPEYLDPVMELWSDLMRPSLREEDFDMEKQVIIEEIRMYDDQPPFGADDRLNVVAAVVGLERTDDGELVRQAGQPRHRVAEDHAGQLGGRGAGDRANRGGRVGLGVEGFKLARPALLKQEDHRLAADVTGRAVAPQQLAAVDRAVSVVDGKHGFPFSAVD